MVTKLMVQIQFLSHGSDSFSAEKQLKSVCITFNFAFYLLFTEHRLLEYHSKSYKPNFWNKKNYTQR